MADVDQIFDRFLQADDSISRRYGGTGLGLAICREFALLMGGAIDVEASPGQGAVFRVSIPMLRLGDTAAQPVQTPDEVDMPPARGMRVLLAEDHPINQRVVQMILEPLGADITVAADGQAAVGAWSEMAARGEAFDIILMDVQMPLMDGLTATSTIRRL